MLDHKLGTVTLNPAKPIVAASVGQWTITYVVGGYGVDEGGTIKLAHRLASDWQQPQFNKPSEVGFATVRTDGHAELAARYDPKGHVRPWMKCIVIDVYDGALAAGDVVTIVLGDRSRGSPGVRAQSFQESAHEFRLFVDPTNACLARPVPDCPVVPIVADSCNELVCIVPTQTCVGQRIDIHVRGQDPWGNPTPAPANLSLTWEGEAKAQIDQRSVRLDSVGSGHILAHSGRIVCRSNPITAYAPPTPYNKYWGDLHAQTDATVGTGTEEEYFTFGRDVARLDFASHQANDFQVTDADWQRLNQAVTRFHEDHRFVVFAGYEWSANTPAGGDRNVIYLDENQRILRSSYWQVPQGPEDHGTPTHPISTLFARLRETVDPRRVLMGAHVGGRYTDIRSGLDEELGALVEVASCWGVFEWLLWDALKLGYVVGVMCNSDGHKGRPGAEAPGAGEFGIAGGLTCVMAQALTRDAVFWALKNRRCYGTTGARIDLDFTIDGAAMGSILTYKPTVQMAATARCVEPIESITLYQGTEPLHTLRPPDFDKLADSRRVRISWRGSRMRGRGRRVSWDGLIKIEGAKILSATPYAFDSPADGITQHCKHQIEVRSKTTGDTDGVDLLLDDPMGSSLIAELGPGSYRVAIDELDDHGGAMEFDLGSLDMALRVERYPEQLKQLSASLHHTIHPSTNTRTPYFVKVTQHDGQMAWASPIYVEAR